MAAVASCRFGRERFFFEAGSRKLNYGVPIRLRIKQRQVQNVGGDFSLRKRMLKVGHSWQFNGQTEDGVMTHGANLIKNSKLRNVP